MSVTVLTMMEQAERDAVRKRRQQDADRDMLSDFKRNITKMTDEAKGKLLQELVKATPIMITYGCHNIELKEKQSYTGFSFAVDSVTDNGIHIHIV